MSYKISLNQKEAAIWLPYPKAVSGFEILGVVDRGDGDKGALAKNKKTGLYVQLNAQVIEQLDQRKIKAALGISNNAGAPKIMKNGRRRNLYIADQDFEKLKEIGNGNASAGVRAILEK